MINNRFYKFRDKNSDILCKIFNISKEKMSEVEGVMFNYTENIVELRDKNYATVAKFSPRDKLVERFNYKVFEYEVLGIRGFHKFLQTIGSSEEGLQWVEVWANGLVKTSYHLHLDFSEDLDAFND